MGRKNAKEKKKPQSAPIDLEPKEELNAKNKNEGDEQLELIDVAPENLKKITPIAKAYRKAMRERMAAGKEEEVLKTQLQQMIKEANIQRLADGRIRFHVDGLLITVTPRDELIQVVDEDKKSNS